MDQKRTPAAQSGVNIVEVVQKLCDEDFYKDDYEETTKKIDF